MTDKFDRYYIDFISCDFCGQPTRGRVYPHSLEVLCGACHAPLLELSNEKKEEDDKEWDALTSSAGSW